MPLEIKTADAKSFNVPTSSELDQSHLTTIEEWLPDCFEEIADVTRRLLHPGESKILYAVEGKNSDPCLIDRLNAELESTCFFIKMEKDGNGEHARERPMIFRLKGTQAEVFAEAARASRLMMLLIFFGLISGVGYLVTSNLGILL